MRERFARCASNNECVEARLELPADFVPYMVCTNILVRIAVADMIVVVNFPTFGPKVVGQIVGSIRRSREKMKNASPLGICCGRENALGFRTLFRDRDSVIAREVGMLQLVPRSWTANNGRVVSVLISGTG